MCNCDYKTGVICGYHKGYWNYAEREQFYKSHIAYLKAHVNVCEGCQHSVGK
jgi:hypothetical protein